MQHQQRALRQFLSSFLIQKLAVPILQVIENWLAVGHNFSYFPTYWSAFTIFQFFKGHSELNAEKWLISNIVYANTLTWYIEFLVYQISKLELIVQIKIALFNSISLISYLKYFQVKKWNFCYPNLTLESRIK